jgi:hypothetical protein
MEESMGSLTCRWLKITLALFILPTIVYAQKADSRKIESLLSRQRAEAVEQLQVAATSAHLKLDPSISIETNVKGASSVVAAVSAASLNLPHLVTGVNVAFGYFDSYKVEARQNTVLPAGFYTIRLTATQGAIDEFMRTSETTPKDGSNSRTRPAAANAQAELIDMSGKVVSRVPAFFGRKPVVSLDSPHIVSGPTEPAGLNAFCMYVGGHLVCWGRDWLEAMDAF